MGKDPLKSIVLVSAAVLTLLAVGVAPTFAQVPVNPATIPKYATPLFVPSAMPSAGTVEAGTVDYYEIAVRQFNQQILPAGFLPTTVWGYGAVNTPASFHYPTYSIEADVNRPVRVKWINDLKNQATGAFLPHLFTVDTGLHWANPPQVCGGRDAGMLTTDCVGTGAAYAGPVPFVTHLHGSHVSPESDGFPEAWYLPAATDIPAGFATHGSDFGQTAGVPVVPGAAVFQYRNDQRATALWFHDHTLGLTRLNIYAGPAGFYLLRGGPSDLAAGLPSGAYELPLMIQDRSFLDNGALLNYQNGDGDTMVVNGNTWPFKLVEQRQYRLRLLNAANRNFQTLTLATDNTPGDNSINDGDYTVLIDPFVQIGADGGFLPAPVAVQEVELGIAERADVIVNFAGFGGTSVYLINTQGDVGTTEQVLRFDVSAAAVTDTSTPALELVLPTRNPLGPADNVRQVSLNGNGTDLLGTVNADGTANPLFWAEAITETPRLNSTEEWQIVNFSGAEHPIHIHLVQFEILGRGDGTVAPGPGETGTKDTVIVHDGETVRVKARFDIPGQYVWHCHILEHEDDEMMRPYTIAADAIPGGGTPGDVNNSGTVTIADALIVLRAALGAIDTTPALLASGDVASPFGVLTIADALYLLRLAAGLAP